MVTITEDYVSFEVAQLLKEKGFDELCDNYYGQSSDEPQQLTLDELYYSNDKFIKAPTHQMAMKWLREKGIFVGIVPQEIGIGITGITYTIDKMTEDLWLPICQNKGFDSYEEAVEAALKYCLENLI